MVTKAAPEDTPIIPGSARGFLITACNKTPDTARAAPATRETIILGNRKFFTISTFSMSPVNRPLISSTEVTSILPVVAEKKNKAISARIAMIKLRNVRLITHTSNPLRFNLHITYLIVLLMLPEQLSSLSYQKAFLLNHTPDRLEQP